MLWDWSLSLEEQFYLSVPLLFFGLSKLRSDAARLTLLGAFWASALAIRLVLYFRHPAWSYDQLRDALYFPTHARFDTLVCGVILAFVQRRWGKRLTVWLEDPAARAALALPSLACLWVLMNPGLFGEKAFGLVHVFAWGTLTSLLYAGWVLLVLDGGDGWVQRFLSAPFWRTLATLGYGVYLLHIPLCDHIVAPLARRLVDATHAPMVLVWSLSVAALFALSLAASYVLHVVVEKPFLWIRDRVAA
jgi:peptidoglycan/LPS O-acetylase OafA/YrhL